MFGGGKKGGAEKLSGKKKQSMILNNFGTVRWMTMIASPEDPRTLMQIKRSRVDMDRRYVFLCPTALNKHFEDLPEAAKEDAILVFKCSREWAFQNPAVLKRGPALPRVDCGRNNSWSPGEGRSSIKVVRPDFSMQFLEWIEAREAENCVFWYKPERSLQKLSEFFEDLADPIMEQSYEPLLLDQHWWRVRFQRNCAKFCHNPARVLTIISESLGDMGTGDLDLVALQELIYQSNPTLEPIIQWPHAPSMRYVPRPGNPLSGDMATSSTSRGFIDQEPQEFSRSHDSHLPVGLKAQKEQTRINQWPISPRMRLDDLHSHWQLEDSVAKRHGILAATGKSFFEERAEDMA